MEVVVIPAKDISTIITAMVDEPDVLKPFGWSNQICSMIDLPSEIRGGGHTYAEPINTDVTYYLVLCISCNSEIDLAAADCLSTTWKKVTHWRNCGTKVTWCWKCSTKAMCWWQYISGSRCTTENAQICHVWPCGIPWGDFPLWNLLVYCVWRTTDSMQEVVVTFFQWMRNAVAAGSDYGGYHFGSSRWDWRSTQVLHMGEWSSGGSCSWRWTPVGLTWLTATGLLSHKGRLLE